MPNAPVPFSQQAQRTHEQPISYFMQQALENPGLISLAAGLVDEPSLPAHEVAQTFAEVFASPASARSALQYGTTYGYLSLRKRLLERFAAEEGLQPESLALTADDVIITNGSQQLLYMLSEVLLNPGDIVLTEAPSYFVFHSVLTSHGAEVIGIPMDEHGLRTDLLETLLLRLEQTDRLDRVKMIYTVDYFQNPSGLSLAPERRRQLLELARRFSKRHRIMIVEDAAYRELRYDDPDVRSIKCLDTTNEYVIYTGTFSKACSPGIRVGYGLLPRELVKPVLWTKGNHDFGSANLNQHLVERLLGNGSYNRHVSELRATYKAKRDVMHDALTAAFREWPGVKWTRPAGGMYFWLRFPAEVPTGPRSALMAECLREGVLYIPGQFCHVTDSAGRLATNEARLCFGIAKVDEIKEGVRRLAKAAKRLTELQGPAPECPAVVA
ncbi:MAG: PLP-dependent aminotransferase family protein [Gemmataceae bacterium]